MHMFAFLKQDVLHYLPGDGEQVQVGRWKARDITGCLKPKIL